MFLSVQSPIVQNQSILSINRKCKYDRLLKLTCSEYSWARDLFTDNYIFFSIKIELGLGFLHWISLCQEYASLNLFLFIILHYLEMIINDSIFGKIELLRNPKFQINSTRIECAWMLNEFLFLHDSDNTFDPSDANPEPRISTFSIYCQFWILASIQVIPSD